MSIDYREHLSAGMDGELRGDEMRFLIRRVDADSQLSPCWARYHVARQVLRRQEVLPLRADFASSIYAHLDVLPVPLHRRVPLLRWASGGAIAAAVAVAALVLTPGQSFDDEPATNLSAANRSVFPAPSSSANRPSPAALASATRSDAPMTSQVLPAVGISALPVSAKTADWAQPIGVDQQLAPYLIRHYQANLQSGASSVVPYVLVLEPARQDGPKSR